MLMGSNLIMLIYGPFLCSGGSKWPPNTKNRNFWPIFDNFDPPYKWYIFIFVIASERTRQYGHFEPLHSLLAYFGGLR